MYCAEILNDYLSCLAELGQRKVTKLANIQAESKKQEVQRKEAITAISSEELIKIPAQVKGHKVKVLFDTGASRNFIN